MWIPRRGSKFVEVKGRVIFDQNMAGSEKDMGVQADRRYMTMLQELENRIHPSIQLEIDYPSRHRG